MSLFSRILKLCDEHHINQSDLERTLGFGKGTISKWKSNPNPNAEKVLLIADYFNVTTDYLLKGIDKDGLNEKDNKDIAKDLNNIMEKLLNQEEGPASFEGNDIPDDDREMFAGQVEIMLRRLKAINKELYNPTKNKK